MRFVAPDASTAETPRVFYRDVKPYEAPEDLGLLAGPGTGELQLPTNVYWGPWGTVDLNIPSDVLKAYQAVLREGRASDQVELLNRDLLAQVWSELSLPDRVRELWETRFPELRA